MELRKLLWILAFIFAGGGGFALGMNAYLNSLVPTQGHETEAWQLLASIEAIDTSDTILPNMIKTFPDDLRAAADDFQIEGYLIRFVAEPYLQDFIIIPDPPNCLYCGGAGYGPYLEVNMKAPLDDDIPDYTKLTLRGTLELIEDPSVYDNAKLIDAILID